LKPIHSSFGKALFLSLAWGAVIGGVATFLGGARNPLAIGMLKEDYDMSIGFLNWMVAVIPMVFVLLAMAYGVIRIFFKPDITSVEAAQSTLGEEVGRLGRMSSREKRIGIMALVTILAWIFLSNRFGLATIAVLSAVSLFIVRAIRWKDIEGYVNWGIILMYGGAIALGTALTKTGAAKWLAMQILSPFVVDPFLLLASIAVVVILLTEGISNVASVAVMLPVAFGFAEAMDINPILVVYVVAVPAGLAYCLPISTPPVAIAFSSGYVRTFDALKGGGLLILLSLFVFLAIVRFYWPLIGLTP
jgi:sodium-dependent dicarboxylate transporter 2/3/5